MGQEHPEPDSLLCAAADGDDVAFAALYDRCAPAVYGLATRVLGDPVASATVARDAFVEAWTHADEFDSRRCSAMTWILDVTHRLAVEAARQKDWCDARVPGESGPAPDDRMTIVLGELPAPCRSSVAGAYYGARTYREMADQFDLSPEFVKVHLRDGMARLRGMPGGDVT